MSLPAIRSPRVPAPPHRFDPSPDLAEENTMTIPPDRPLTASRLYAMVRERGYRGSGDHFRHLIACYRPRPAAEAYLRLRSLPGEQAQVDWGQFWSSRDRPRTPSLDGLRHGAELLAPDFPALLPRCPHGELPARSRRRLHGLERMCA